MPMSIIEAMATGLPIVATAVGGVPDMVTHGESAILVPCDSTAVADACLKLIQSPELREKLGRNSLRDSVKFSAQKMAERYCRIYTS
jgi:glycosyltransferase involved in cell wall biosynthesis